MQCPKCWSDKAQPRPVSGLVTAMYAALLVLPMRCGRCQHDFCVGRLTHGGSATAPASRLPARGQLRKHRAANSETLQP